jgi:hypothetical protein
MMKIQRRLAAGVLLMLGVAAGLVLTAYAATIVTGRFTAVAMDTPTVRTIDTGLTHIRSLTILVDVRGMPPQVIYTQDQLQADRPGRFLNQTQSKWATGLAINPGGSFTLNHEIFKRPGANYYWEARGD